MPRYFVHLCDRSASVFDDEGIDLVNDEAALDHAIWCIRDIVSNSILSDQAIDLSSYMTIHAPDGTELRRIYFHEVIRFLRDDPLTAKF